MVGKKRKQSGFGLVEVLVSISIISLVIVAFNQTAIYAYRNWEDARAKSVAYNLIQQITEDLRNRRDTNVNTTGNTWSGGTFPANSANGTTLYYYTYYTVGGENYSVYWNIYPVSVTLPNLPASSTVKKKVTIEVRWTERVGVRTLKSVTYLTDWKGKY